MNIVYLLMVICLVAIIPGTISMNWVKFLWCAGSDIYSCPGQRLKAQYHEMTRANCMNCDKFFHCQGNYDAVQLCERTAANLRITKKSNI